MNPALYVILRRSEGPKIVASSYDVVVRDLFIGAWGKGFVTSDNSNILLWILSERPWRTLVSLATLAY